MKPQITNYIKNLEKIIVTLGDKLKCKRYLSNINLQLFAGDDKTEKATQKKRSDARKKGQVLQSREVSASIVLISAFIGIKIFGSKITEELMSFMQRIFTEYANKKEFGISELAALYSDAMGVLFKTLTPIFAIVLLTGVFVEIAQIGFLFTVETLGFKFDRINPLSGFKRIFSLRAVVDLVKSLLKIAVISYVAYSYLQGEVNTILNLMEMDVVNIGIYIATTAINVALRVCIALIIVGIIDYIYQWWEFEKSLRMSKEEIKEEYKQMEGNPEIKAKIKQKQRQLSMRSMLNDVPKADVVITNPTHFAVAIKYDSNLSVAPIVLAKGQDFIAKRIKEVAKENNVEIVENRPLARALYDSVEVGGAIPADLYQAVAEVLAFIYSLKK